MQPGKICPVHWMSGGHLKAHDVQLSMLALRLHQFYSSIYNTYKWKQKGSLHIATFYIVTL